MKKNYCEQILDKDHLKQLHPYLHVNDLEGAIWVPEDAVADPSAICEILAKLAKQGGARYIENCRIEQVYTKNKAVQSVRTDQGMVICEYFINCAGMVNLILIHLILTIHLTFTLQYESVFLINNIVGS